MLQNFLDGVMPAEVMNTAVWINDPITLGIDTVNNGLFSLSDWIGNDVDTQTRTYMAAAFNTRSKLTAYDNLSLSNCVNGALSSLSGSVYNQSVQLKAAVTAQFPNNQWTVVVKTGDGGFDNWAYFPQNGNYCRVDSGNYSYAVWGTTKPARPLATITFAPGLSGQTITLTSGLLYLAGVDFNINASALPNGITLSGNNVSRIFQIAPGATATLVGLTIAHGSAIDANGTGGGIYNQGNLNLYNSTLSFNGCNYGGGALANVTGGSVFLQNCTVASNITYFAASAAGILNLSNSTLTLRHCTVAGNSSPTQVLETGLGIANFAPSVLTIESTIVADNVDSHGTSANLFGNYNGAFVGTNIIPGLAGTLLSGRAPITLDPLLGPLANNGGATATMAPLPLSPAINAAAGSTLTIDQRSVPRPIGTACDIGAVEATITGQSPVPGQLYVSAQGVILTWSAVPGATFEVWFDNGTGTLTQFGGPTASTSVALPSPLTLGTKYTWRVDTIFGAVTLTGYPVNFTTRGPLVVTTVADENDPGLGLGTGDSLRELIAVALPGETITFAPGLAGKTIVLGGTQLVLTNNLTIDASMLPGGMTINAANHSRVFAMTSAISVNMFNLTLCGGNSGFGGAISNNAGALGLTNCILTDNQSPDFGGAIYNANGGSLSLYQITVSGNTAGNSGGGICSSGGGSLNLVFSTVSGNSATTNGGGIWNSGGGSLAIFHSSLSGNTATNSGGGIYTSVASGQSNTIDASTLSVNSAAMGGGLFVTGGTTLVVNCTLARNASTTGQGAGAYSQGTTALTLQNCTIADNVGAGVFNNSPATLTLDNTIIANNVDLLNSPLDLQGDCTTVGANLVRMQTGTLLGGPAPLTADPLLGNLASDFSSTLTMAPLAGSPVIDAGITNAASPQYDEDGNPRPYGAAADIGAVESRLNGDANLDWLLISVGNFSPSFQSALTNYSVTVAYAVTTAGVRAATALNGQTLKVRINGGTFASLASTAASAPLPLNLGANAIEVKVTAQDGITTRSYILTLIRSAPSAADASLASLTTSSGPFSPAFNPLAISYSTFVSNNVTTTTVTAAPANAGATMAVRSNFGAFTPLGSGAASAPLALNVGANIIDISVTAQNGTNTSDYTITVTREAPAISNTELAALSTSAGNLTPGFSRGLSLYNVAVPNQVTSATFTASPVQASAKISIRANGGAFSSITSGVASSPISLKGGVNVIQVQVTAADELTIKSYTLLITRTARSIAWASERRLTPAGAANNQSCNPAISSDGRFVAFSSRASDLVTNDLNNSEDIFVYDSLLQVVQCVSMNNAGQLGTASSGPADSRNPSISADGR